MADPTLGIVPLISRREASARHKKYVVKLTAEERRGLQTLVSQGRAAARTISRAWILLKADAGLGPGWSAEEIRTTVTVGLATI